MSLTLFGREALPFGRRQRRARGARVPVVLVTGFLGAGKTTLVRHLIGSEAARNTAVVVNEFGEVGIDQAVLAPGTATTVLLGNGCVCCAVRSGLDTTFRNLHSDRARGLLPSFERVVLETSGADDPGPILQTFLSERALGREYHLQSVVAVVDAATGGRALDAAPEARRQVAVADRLVITKRDLAPPGAAEALLARLRAINPHAPVGHAEHGRIDPGFLLADSDLPHPGALVAEAAGRHGAELNTFTLVFEQPFRWPELTAALNLLCDLRGADLLRVKGLVATNHCRGPVLVHAVQHILHRPTELESWPDADRRSRLVFVTRGLERRAVLDLFEAVLALGEPRPARDTEHPEAAH